MKNNFLGKKILMLTAHPDDESFAAAGAVYLNQKRGGSTILVCATLGERGVSHMRKVLSPAKVKEIRRLELERCSKFLKIKKVYFLGLPDTKLKENAKILRERFMKIAKRHNPEVILSFGAHGLTGHLDHIAVGAAAAYIAKKMKIDLYTFAFPPSLASTMKRLLPARRKYGRYSKAAVFRYDRSNMVVKIDPKIKKKAMACHESQLDQEGPFGSFPKRFRNVLLNKEFFAYVK